MGQGARKLQSRGKPPPSCPAHPTHPKQQGGCSSSGAAREAGTGCCCGATASAPAAAAASGALVLSPEVAAALAEGRPVVALESTIIAHGMPYPQNLHTAREVEGVVRAHGAVPATIALLGGVPHVGLSPPQLERLAAGGAAVRKASRRDLPLVAALGLDGATTVSATMLLAARAGIDVFVTGGERGGQGWGGWVGGWVGERAGVVSGCVGAEERCEGCARRGGL